MNMIELVAKALHEHGVDPENGYSWDDASPSEKDHAKGYARAAIEAMREPDEMMERAGGEVWGPSYADDAKVRENVRAEYTAMIGAALGESK